MGVSGVEKEKVAAQFLVVVVVVVVVMLPEMDSILLVPAVANDYQQLRNLPAMPMLVILWR